MSGGEGERRWSELQADLTGLVRSLRRRPGYTLAALATFSLGLGASAALMALVDSILLRPLPYPEADRVHAVWFVSPTLPGGLDRVRHSEGTYLHWRESSRAYETFALAERTTVTLDDGVDSRRLPGARVTADIHAVLRREAAEGRSLQPEDVAPGAEPVVLLADALWTEQFARDPDVVGRVLTVDGVGRRVVGVLPSDVRFPSEDVRLWVPMTVDEARPDALNFLYTGYGRLAAGADLQAAEADFRRLVQRLPDALPQAFPRPLLERARFSPKIVSLPDVVLGDSRPVLALLGVAVLVLLAVAGVNVTGLVVVRTEGRMRDLAVRAASGATTARLRRAVVLEGVGLAWVGAGVGLLLAGPALAAFAGAGGDILPRLSGVGLGGGVAVVTLGAATLLGLVAGTLPALRIQVERLTGPLRSGTRSVGDGRSAARLRHALVVAQVALAVVLVLNAGLLVRSFQRLRTVETGFDAEGVLAASFALDGRSYPAWEDARPFLLDFQDRTSRLPGVRAAALSNHLPLRAGRIFRPFVVQDVPSTLELPNPRLTRVVSDGYFGALGVEVVEGRAFDRDDLLQNRPVVMVSRGLARSWWPGESALGRLLSYGFDAGAEEPEWLEVVGVADDVRDRAVREDAPAMVYVPLQLRHLPDERWREWSMVLRSSDPSEQVAPLRATLADRDRRVPLYAVRTMDAVLGDVTRRDRVVTVLLVGAALSALFLAAVGLYGVLSFVVGQRRREMGLRLALGARPAQVRRLVLRRAGLLVAVGLAAGAVGSTLTRGLVGRTLFRTAPDDPAAVVAVVLLLAAVAAL
ncbi:MAG: ADOP family duplicated permease, partial [Gemmatimonadota bacterium]